MRLLIEGEITDKYYFTHLIFFVPPLTDGFSLESSLLKCPQQSRTLLSILANLNYSVVWIVTTRPLISKSSSFYRNHLVTALRAPVTTGISVTFIFHNFFSFLARSWYLSLFTLYFSFILRLARTPKFTIQPVFFFFLFVDNHW